MQFDSVYGIYPLIGFLLFIVVNLYIIIREIIKLNTLDRIDAFQYGFESYTKQKEEQVLPEADIDNSLSDPNGYAYEMVDDNDEILGGCIVNINPNTNINHLDFLFVKVGTQFKGIGQATWKEIELLYPNTEKWVTCTPYFDVRNIHFYVNKLKFHIVEFYNEHHPDPHMPNDFIGDGGEGMFEFEKLMEEKKYDSNNL